ncbi:MAG: hypothetical protein JW827_10570 [Spirochaetes bacterium]|nr:hypothetical protein [Spirochaetota bacterium]
MKSHPLRKWVKRFFIVFFILLILFLLLTFLLNKLLPKEQLKSIIKRSGTSYLGREFNFQDIHIDVFKGIVISGLEINALETVPDSVHFSIDQIQLRHNWRSLLKLRLDINRIIVNHLKIDFTQVQLDNEIHFYKQKFKKEEGEDTGSSKAGIQIDIKSIEGHDNRIIYRKKKQNIQIDLEQFLIQFHEKGRLKINSDLQVQYEGDRIILSESLVLGEKDREADIEVDFPSRDIQVNMKTSSTDGKNFNFKARGIYRDNNLNFGGNALYLTNRFILYKCILSDISSSLITIKGGMINLDSEYFKIDMTVHLDSFNKRNNPVLQFVLPDELDLNVNGTANLALKGGLNLKKMLADGGFLFQDSYINISGETIKFNDLKGIIENNDMSLSAGFHVVDKIKGHVRIKKEDCFKTSPPAELKGSIRHVNWKSLFPELERFKMDRALFDISFVFPMRLCKVNKMSILLPEGKIMVNGIYHLKKNLENNITVSVEKWPVENFITNNIKGEASGEANISFTVDTNNQFRLNQLYGKVESDMNVGKYNFLVSTPFVFKDQKMVFSSGLLEIKDNRVSLNGEYDVKEKIMTLNGKANKFIVDRLDLFDLSGQLNMDFSFQYFEKEKNQSLDFKIDSPAIIFNNLKFNNIKGQAFLKKDLLEAQIDVPQFYSGSVTMKGTGKLDDLAIMGKGTNIQLERLAKDLSAKVKELEGGTVTGTLQFDIGGQWNLLDGKMDNSITGLASKGEMRDTKFQNNLTDLLPHDIFYKNINITMKIRQDHLLFEKVELIGQQQQIYFILSGKYDIKNLISDLVIKDLRVDEDFVKFFPNPTLILPGKKDDYYFIKKIDYYQKSTGKPKIDITWK